MKNRRIVAVLALVSLPVALLACPRHEEPEDKPTATPPPPPPPTATQTATVVAAEDAGAPDVVDASDDAADADASDAKVATGPTNLQKCCNAIKQNQKNAPP